MGYPARSHVVSHAEHNASPGDAAKIATDVAALKQSVLVNAAGYAVKLGMPILLAFGTRTYGAASWGVFVTVQAVLMIALRVTLLGFDKALLWWVPNRGPAGYGALRPAMFLAVLVSSAFAGLIAWLGEPIFDAWHGITPAEVHSLKIMVLGLPLYAATELLLHACMGRRRMEPNVVVRETLTPASLIAIALALHAAGLADTGLAWGFVLSNVVSLVAAIGFYRRVFASEPAAPPMTRVPREFVGYAVPAWLAEILNSSLMRVNALVVAAFTDPITVAVWSIVTQFGVAMRTIRGAFDGIVTVLAADIARAPDSRRLTATVSYAAQLVSLTQYPLFAFLTIFADLILPLYGEEFARGSRPLVVLCAFWLANGATGLAGVVLAGYGKSHLTLMNTLITIVSQAVMLVVLVPTLGLIGASIALGASYSFQHVAQLIQLKLITGAFHFSRRAAQPFLPAIAAAAAAIAVYTAIASQGLNAWAERSLTFAAFAAVYGAITFWHWKRGDLRAPGSEAA